MLTLQELFDLDDKIIDLAWSEDPDKYKQGFALDTEFRKECIKAGHDPEEVMALNLQKWENRLAAAAVAEVAPHMNHISHVGLVAGWNNNRKD